MEAAAANDPAEAAVGAVGGLVAALIGLGLPEDAARSYQRELDAGRTAVTVKTDDRAGEAIDVLVRNGAVEALLPQVRAGIVNLP